MKSYDVFNEQIGRLEFSKKICHGKILDVTHGDYLSYHSASNLLNEHNDEVWSFDISEDDTCILMRTLIENNEIKVKNLGKPEISLKNEYFDFIISSETIQHSKNYEEEVELYHNILKNNGKLIISTSNKNAPKKIKNIQNDMAIKNEFSKNEFINILSKKFKKIEVFSQRIIDNEEIKMSESLEKMRSREKIRYFFSELIKKIDQKQIIYTSIISKIKFSKVLNVKENKYIKDGKTIDTKYVPLKYKDTDEPLFFILICHKMRN